MNEPFILVHALRGFQATVAGKKDAMDAAQLFLSLLLTREKTVGPKTVLYHNPQRPASCDTGTTTFPNNWGPNVQIHENVDNIFLSNQYLHSTL